MAQNLELFATDGFRGEYQELSTDLHEVHDQSFQDLAAAFVTMLKENGNEHPTVIVGGDTRSSGNNLRAAAIVGALQAGAEVLGVSVAPTPAIAWLAKRNNVAAIAITASHNPDADNGFKPFAVGGAKLSEPELMQVEDIYFRRLHSRRNGNGFGTYHNMQGLKRDYVRGIVDKFGGPDARPLDGRLLVVDGANGAAHELAPQLYEALGATVVPFACDLSAPINDGSGAAHLDGLQGFLHSRPDITADPRFIGALSHDGDADRVMGLDRFGREINGNHWLHHLASGQTGIVGTLYTNTGLRQAVEAMGVNFYECDNGDSAVTAELLRRGLTHGGEFTGHIIDLEHLSSGDGLYMGGYLANQQVRRDEDFADVYDGLKLWPEEKATLKLSDKRVNAKQLVAAESVQEARAELLARYAGSLNIVLRASGTEPVIRIWAESPGSELAYEAVATLQQNLEQQLQNL